MELAFANRRLRDLCESRKKATNAFGLPAARELEQRLADLDALSNVAEMSELFPGEILDYSASEKILHLQTNLSLRFTVGHVEIPCTAAGEIDWANVSRIKIVSLEASND